MAELFNDLKDYLNISYADEQTDRALKTALERGKKVLEDYAGTELNFDEEGAARQLLLDYCRYVRSQATEMFEVNYKHDLIALREIEEVKHAKNSNTT